METTLRPPPLLLTLLLLGAAHGLSDGAAGYLVGEIGGRESATRVALLVLLYNGLAFATQPFLGAVVDHFRRPRVALVAGLALMGVALFLRAEPLAAILCAGVASSLLHIGGGAMALDATPGRAVGPALFAAPGVLGLAAGGALGIAGVPMMVPLAALLALVAVALFALPTVARPTSPARDAPLLEDHDLIMMLLLGAIALRSALWSAIEGVMAGDTRLLLALAGAAMVGKLLGGPLADRFGWRRWTLGALSLSSILLTLGRGSLVALLVGVALLQSVTPVAIAAVARVNPGRPATSAGLALGLAIAIGGFAIMEGAGPILTSAPALAVAVIAIALTVALRRSRRTRRVEAAR